MDLSVVIELVKMRPYEDMFYCERSRSIKTRLVTCPGYTSEQLMLMRHIAFELGAEMVHECGAGLAAFNNKYHVNLQTSDGSGRTYLFVKGEEIPSPIRFTPSIEGFREKIKEIENAREPIL